MNRESDIRTKAWAAHHGGQLLEAERLYRQLLQETSQQTPSGDVRDAINLGALLRSQGRLKEASAHYHRSLERFPAEVSLVLNGVNCLRDLGEHGQALQWLALGLASQPHNLELLQAQAKTLLAKGEKAEALRQFQALVAHHPGQKGLWLDLGLCCHSLGDLAGALGAFERVAALDPEDLKATANRITLMKELGLLEEAETLIKGLPESLRQANDVQGAISGLWIVQQRLEEAAVLLEQLCEKEPEQPVHWVNRAACLRGLKNMVACTQVLKQGLRWHPGHGDLEQALGQSLAEMGRHGAAMELLQRSCGPIEQLSDSHLFNLQFLGAGYGLIAPAERRAMARHWEARKRAEGVGPLWADTIRDPLANRPLRVGYLSADFANHPVGRFLLPVLQQHNRQEVEVWGLSCCPHQDKLREKLEAACDHWLDVRFGSDLEVARVISDLKLDVLVELGGFTGNSRLAVLAQRPAPLQLSYLGFYAPTYLEAIDGWIGDEVLFGDLAVEDQHQELLLVKGGYMAFVPEELPPLEARCGAPRFRFGSFNHARKLTGESVALFCGVLAAVPEAELVLKSISFVELAERERVQRLFAGAGLAPDRLVLLPWIEGWANHVALYRELDVALDPLPYGGATTSCEALAMGVPVISLAGQGMVRRLSASVLAAAGLEGWIAENQQQYVEIAKGLAAKGPRQLQQRQALREQVLGSPLGDGQRLSRDLERLYRAAAKAAQRC